MSALQEAVSAVISFLDEEADNRSAAGSDMSDYAREPRDLAERLGDAFEAAQALTAAEAEVARLREALEEPDESAIQEGIEEFRSSLINGLPDDDAVWLVYRTVLRRALASLQQTGPLACRGEGE